MSSRSRVALVAALGAGLLGAAWPAEALAQRLAVRRARAVRPVVVVGVGFHAYRPFYAYRPYDHDPFYWSSLGWYPYGSWGGPRYAHLAYGVPYGPLASVRLRVTPPEAEVFVDGYLVGVVDDFDGFAQRLRLEPGEHQLELYLEGHRSVREKLRLRPGQTYRVSYVMEKLAPGEDADPRPVPDPAAATPRARDRGPGPARERRAAARAGFGSLAVRVQPADAEVLVDGERWDPPDTGDRLVIELAAGPHRVEARKDGYKAYVTEVVVRPGDVTTLNVSLPREKP